MSVLTSLRIAFCCSLSLTIPLCASATTATDSFEPATARAVESESASGTMPSDSVDTGDNRPLTVAVIMPGDNAPTIAANKIVLNGLTAASIRKPNIRLIMVESSSNDNLDNQLKAAAIAGADVAIGPLSRERVDALLRLPSLPLPVIALNTPTHNMIAENDAHLLMMSLSTELEANYVAKLAAESWEQLNNPLSKVLIVRDANKTDYRVTAGYETALQDHVVPYQIMPIDPATINSLKQLTPPQLNSEQRQLYVQEISALSQAPSTEENLQRLERLKNALRSVESQGTTQFPVALLSLDAAQASLVINRLPRNTQIWGISLLNPGDPETNPTASSLVYDMNNAVFVDSPLLVEYNNESFEAKFQTAMPYSLTAKRLFALGVDALATAERWAHQEMTFKFSGESGTWTSNRGHSALLDRKPATILIQDGTLQLLTLEPSNH